MDTKAALKKMWALAEKHERMRAFHHLVTNCDLDVEAEDFWDHFWNIWTSSENLNEDTEFFRVLIEHGQTLGHPWIGLDDDERKALDAMAETFRVYRGCVEWNQDGWSWTTDIETARKFAKRAFCDNDADHYILSAEVNRSDVLAYHTGRGESEIVIDPENLLDVEIEETFSVPGGGSQGLFYAIQSGKFELDNPEMGTARGQMMAQTAHAPFEPMLEYIGDALSYMEWAGLTAKKSYLEALRDALLERQKNPEAVATADFSFNL